MSHTKKRILVLIRRREGPNDKNWNFFRESIEAAIGEADHEVVMGGLLDLTFEISDKIHRIYDPKRGFELKDFDLVVFRIIRQEFSRAAACASLLQELKIPYIDTQTQPGPWSKYSAAAMRRAAGLNTIASVFAQTQQLLNMIEQDSLPFAYPVVIKDVNGKKGRLNFIAHNSKEAADILRANFETPFIIQEFIKNEGDYRFLVMGGKIVFAMHRLALGDSHLNNTSQGGRPTLESVESFEQKVLDDVVKAAELEHIEVAGVDVMFDSTTGKHYIIEVNSSPQLATGGYPELKMAAYADYLKSITR